MTPTVLMLISILVFRGDGFLLDDKPTSTTQTTAYSVEDLIHLIVEEKALRNSLETKLIDLTKELRNVERIVTDFYHEVKDNITMLQVTASSGIIDKRLSDMDKKLNETTLSVQNASAIGIIDKRLSDMDKKLNKTIMSVHNASANTIIDKRLSDMDKRLNETILSVQNASANTIIDKCLSNMDKKLNETALMVKASADGIIDKRFNDIGKKLNETIMFLQNTSANDIIVKQFRDMDKQLNKTKVFIENITATGQFERNLTESKLTDVENKCKLNEVFIQNMSVLAQQSNQLIQSRIGGLKTTLIDDVSSLNSTVTDVEMKMQNLTNFTTEYLHRSSYAFFAYWLKDVALQAHNALIFTKELVNENGAYNKSSGEYLVPVDGTYTFSTTLCSSGNRRWVYIIILADAYEMNNFFLLDFDDNLCRSTSTIGSLRKGMKVKIIVQGRPMGSDAIFYQTKNRMNHFSGFLIK